MSCHCRNKHVHGHGSSRSLVRKIGSRLPINPEKRVYIRVPGMDSPHVGSASEFRYEATGERYIPSEEGLTIASCINEPQQSVAKAVGLFQADEDDLEEVGMVEEVCVDNVFVDGDQVKQGTIDKISALEVELARLRAQIADYAVAETDHLPSLPSVPPPPPPPLPPHEFQPRSMTTSTPSALPTSSTHNTATGRTYLHQPPELMTTPVRPDFSSMLQDIGSVKLRRVQGGKSPGGTPLRPTNKAGRMSDPNDPASIIAQALRRKFAHNIFRDSPDKENLDRSDASLPSAFESPTIKLLH